LILRRISATPSDKQRSFLVIQLTFDMIDVYPVAIDMNLQDRIATPANHRIHDFRIIPVFIRDIPPHENHIGRSALALAGPCKFRKVSHRRKELELRLGGDLKLKVL